MKMLKTKNYARHGDLSFRPVDKIEGEEIKHDGSFTLALGEATGHKHVITCPDITKMKVYKLADGGYIIDLREKAVLTHEEHKSITFEPGTYKMETEREFDWFGLKTKKVVD